MKVKIYDTHVKTVQDDYYHFDVVVVDASKEKVEEYARGYLSSIGVDDSIIKTKTCEYCHDEMAEEHVEKSINDKGFYIISMEGCPQNS